MQSTTQIKNIIITKEKRFKVISLNGKVMALRIGLITSNKRPMTIPIIMMVSISPSEVIPGTKYRDKAVPTIPEMILDKKAFIK